MIDLIQCDEQLYRCRSYKEICQWHTSISTKFIRKIVLKKFDIYIFFNILRIKRCRKIFFLNCTLNYKFIKHENFDICHFDMFSC